MSITRAVFYCTKETPWRKEHHVKGTQVVHDAVVTVGEQRDGWPGGDLQDNQCRNCGHTWTQELPQ